MTQNAVAALKPLAIKVMSLGDALEDADWARPSACPGWSVHDILIHLTCTLREVVAPHTLPAPVPGSIERSNDAGVAAYRHQSPAQTVADYAAFVPDALGALRDMQEEPSSSEVIDFDDAGTYPAHLIADSLVFDHYCHLRHDLAGRGPLDLEVPESADIGRANLDWLLAGLPQMSPPRLLEALRAPVDLEITGPGGGLWTLRRADDHAEVVAHVQGSNGRIVTSADEFLLWGTRRRAWQDAQVAFTGDRGLAAEVASAIHVF